MSDEEPQARTSRILAIGDWSGAGAGMTERVIPRGQADHRARYGQWLAGGFAAVSSVGRWLMGGACVAAEQARGAGVFWISSGHADRRARDDQEDTEDPDGRSDAGKAEI